MAAHALYRGSAPTGALKPWRTCERAIAGAHCRGRLATAIHEHGSSAMAEWFVTGAPVASGPFREATRPMVGGAS